MVGVGPYDLPAPAWQVAKGIAKAGTIFFFLVLVPYVFFTTVLIHLPIQIGLDPSLYLGLGTTIAVLGGLVTATRATRAFGLFKALSHGAKITYLVVLVIGTRATLAVSHVSAYFSATPLFELLLIASVFGAASGIVTFLEDLKHPTERYPFDFPAKNVMISTLP